MGGAARTTAAAARGSALRPFFSYRVFVSAMFTLLFLATLSVLLSTSPASLHSQVPTSFLPLKTTPVYRHYRCPIGTYTI